MSDIADGTDRRHRVVVIGSGFGGLTATKALKHASVDVTVIARTQHHLFQPLLWPTPRNSKGVSDEFHRTH
jgi:NADH dehydrogenase FAD-containing subunit